MDSGNCGNAGKAVKLGDGTWQLNACPMDGGGIAVANGEGVTAWRRDNDVYLAIPGKKETRLGTGKDISLAADGTNVFAVWSDTGIRSWVSGKVESLSEAGAFPVVVGMGDGSALFAWEQQGSIALRRWTP